MASLYGPIHWPACLVRPATRLGPIWWVRRPFDIFETAVMSQQKSHKAVRRSRPIKGDSHGPPLTTSYDKISYQNARIISKTNDTKGPNLSIASPPYANPLSLPTTCLRAAGTSCSAYGILPMSSHGEFSGDSMMMKQIRTPMYKQLGHLP